MTPEQLAVERAKPATNWTMGEIERLLDRAEKAEAEARFLKTKAAGDYWAWGGDGEDHPESLVCPVLIRAEHLRQILRAAPKWTKEPPKSTGLFWWRKFKGDERIVNVVFIDGIYWVGVKCPVADMGGEWAGPLTPPETTS